MPRVVSRRERGGPAGGRWGGGREAGPLASSLISVTSWPCVRWASISSYIKYTTGAVISALSALTCFESMAKSVGQRIRCHKEILVNGKRTPVSCLDFPRNSLEDKDLRASTLSGRWSQQAPEGKWESKTGKKRKVPACEPAIRWPLRTSSVTPTDSVEQARIVLLEGQVWGTFIYLLPSIVASRPCPRAWSPQHFQPARRVRLTRKSQTFTWKPGARTRTVSAQRIGAGPQQH